MLYAIFSQIVLPLLLLIYFIQGTKSALSMIVRAVIVIGAMWGVRTLAEYLIVPWYAFYLYVALLAIVALMAVFFRRQVLFSSRRRAALVLRFDAIVALVVINMNIYILLGEAPDYSNIVSLEPPILGQSVFVMNGGTHSLMNDHVTSFWSSMSLGESDDRPAHYYGLDLVPVNDDGRASAVWFPQDDYDYSGYNIFIYSPCSGVVQLVGNDETDGVLNTDLGQMMLSCGSFEVQLGHLLLDSIVLQAGDRVVTGQALGALGTANEDKPPYLHLHVHRRETQTNGFVKIVPVQVSIGENFLARGDIAP